jgi:hypothetical protein
VILQLGRGICRIGLTVQLDQLDSVETALPQEKRRLRVNRVKFWPAPYDTGNSERISAQTYIGDFNQKFASNPAPQRWTVKDSRDWWRRSASARLAIKSAERFRETAKSRSIDLFREVDA